MYCVCLQVTRYQVVKVATNQTSSHLFHQVKRGFNLSMTEIGGPDGATYLPVLVLHHTALSNQKEMATF